MEFAMQPGPRRNRLVARVLARARDPGPGRRDAPRAKVGRWFGAALKVRRPTCPGVAEPEKSLGAEH